MFFFFFFLIFYLFSDYSKLATCFKNLFKCKYWGSGLFRPLKWHQHPASPCLGVITGSHYNSDAKEPQDTSCPTFCSKQSQLECSDNFAPGLYPVWSWKSPGMETANPLWVISSTAGVLVKIQSERLFLLPSHHTQLWGTWPCLLSKQPVGTVRLLSDHQKCQVNPAPSASPQCFILVNHLGDSLLNLLQVIKVFLVLVARSWMQYCIYGQKKCHVKANNNLLFLVLFCFVFLFCFSPVNAVQDAVDLLCC